MQAEQQYTVYTLHMPGSSTLCTVYAGVAATHCVQCTLYAGWAAAHCCTVYTLRRLSCRTLCTLYSGWAAVHCVHSTQARLKHTVYSVRRRSCSTLCTVYSLCRLSFSTLCTVYTLLRLSSSMLCKLYSGRAQAHCVHFTPGLQHTVYTLCRPGCGATSNSNGELQSCFSGMSMTPSHSCDQLCPWSTKSLGSLTGLADCHKLLLIQFIV